MTQLFAFFMCVFVLPAFRAPSLVALEESYAVRYACGNLVRVWFDHQYFTIYYCTIGCRSLKAIMVI